MSPYETIDYDVDDGTAELYFNRPETLNAFTDELLDEAIDALHTASQDPEVQSIILSGRGRGFCSGVDLTTVSTHNQSYHTYSAHRDRADSLYSDLYFCPKPVIAAINGPAVGAGLGFALCCDFRVMNETTVISDAHVTVDLAPSAPVGWILPRLINPQRAKEFILSGREMDAAEALETGLVLATAPDTETVATARNLAKTVHSTSKFIAKETLALLDTQQTFDEYITAAKAAQWRCRTNPDYTNPALD